MQEYADPVIDWLDGGRGLFGKKLYRDVSPRYLFSFLFTLFWHDG